MKPITTFLFIISLITTGFSQEAYMKTQHFDDNFVYLDSTYILLPISWTGTGKFNDFKIETSYDFDLRNIIFYNVKNDSCRYLFSDSMQIIRQIQGRYNERSLNRDRRIRYTFNDYLLFEVINEDYNQDERLNQEDPVYLYASKSDGTQLIQITPKYYSFKHYEYFEKENFLLVVLMKDSNADKKFDNNDMEVVYKIDLTNFKKSKIIADLKIKSR